jgi:hypothetical protein
MDFGRKLKIIGLTGVSLIFAACGVGDFNYGKVHNIIEGTPMRLDAEYVMLTPSQLDCGVEEDLWDAPVEAGQRDHRVSHLKQSGRDLKFADDVSVGDMGKPYVQIRGEFNLNVADIVNDKDGPEPGTRLVISHIGITIPHKCFNDPLPLMGVRKGNFTQDVPPVLFFRYVNGWTIERIVH